MREVQLDYLIEGPSRGWLHTHGLAKHGKPELELRNVPMFLRGPAGRILNEIANYLLNRATKPLLAGQTMRLGNDVILFVESGPDEDAGYDPFHYAGCVRLRLVDPPPHPCDCDECAKELARRSSLLPS